MRFDIEKFIKFNKSLLITIFGAGAILIVIVISTIISQMSEREALYMEGAIKSAPLIKDDMIAELGTLYVELEDEFEHEINNIILSYSYKKNKRGDNIFYGVNGRNNKFEVEKDIYSSYEDSLVNEDYVNGVNLKYIKSDSTKADGESNFNDMIAVISAIYGEDCDRYKDDVKDTFKKLFDISHSYKAEATDLYPCKHGCCAILYYCGDSLVQGTYAGETVGHFNTDLKYSPFKIKSHSLYRRLQEYYDLLTEGKSYEIEVGFAMEDYEGICDYHRDGKTKFTSTTKNFAGCNQPSTCYHANSSPDPARNCKHYHPNPRCIPPEDAEDHDCGVGESYEDDEGNQLYDENGVELVNLGCAGYYKCDGHDHWNCHGHVLICCFGHTTLNLDVSILYYEAMLDELRKLRR